MTTQTETIVWHKFPDEEPKVSGGIEVYLIQYALFTPCIGTSAWQGGRVRSWSCPDAIIAWAEMPMGWQE